MQQAIHLNEEQLGDLLREKKPFVVDYWAPWCGYCRRIAPAYDRIAEQYGGRILVAKINIDEAPELAKEEHIDVIPTLVFYKGGKAADRLVAPESQGVITQFVEKNL